MESFWKLQGFVWIRSLSLVLEKSIFEGRGSLGKSIGKK